VLVDSRGRQRPRGECSQAVPVLCILPSLSSCWLLTSSSGCRSETRRLRGKAAAVRHAGRVSHRGRSLLVIREAGTSGASPDHPGFHGSACLGFHDCACLEYFPWFCACLGFHFSYGWWWHSIFMFCYEIRAAT
jgi:hypothetical protein